MIHVTSSYKKLYTQLNNILPPNERDGKNYLEELYEIASEMIKFKECGGSLLKDYDGNGELMSKFSQEFFRICLPIEVKANYQNFFEAKDIKNNTQIYRKIFEEYQIFQKRYNNQIEQQVLSFTDQEQSLNLNYVTSINQSKPNLGKYTKHMQEQKQFANIYKTP